MTKYKTILPLLGQTHTHTHTHTNQNDSSSLNCSTLEWNASSFQPWLEEHTQTCLKCSFVFLLSLICPPSKEHTHGNVSHSIPKLTPKFLHDPLCSLKVTPHNEMKSIAHYSFCVSTLPCSSHCERTHLIYHKNTHIAPSKLYSHHSFEIPHSLFFV
jgi:hypothetical protein